MVVRDADGDVQNGAQVTLRQPGTSTPITQAIYDAVSGGGTLSNPLTANAKGEVEGYLPLPERFDAYVSSPTSLFTAYTVPNEGTGPDPSWYTGQWYDVTLPWGGTAGAQGDATGLTGGGTDDTAAIQAAIDACGAAGGGVVYFPPGRYRITSRLTVAYPNVHLVGQGQAHFVQTGSVVLGRASLLLDFTARPAILVGGGTTVNAGAGFSIESMQVAIPSGVAPVGTTYEGGTTYATVLFDRAGYQSGSGTTAVVTGRCWVKNVRFYDNSTTSVSVQNGTPNTPKGSGALWVEDCEGYSGLDFARIYGGGYLFLIGNHVEQNPTPGTGAFVRFTGAMGAGAPDGIQIVRNFPELFDVGLLDEHSSGSLASVLFAHNKLDRCKTYGIHVTPSGGSTNAWNVWANEIKGNATAGSIGVRIANSNGADVTTFSILNNQIAGFGTYGMLIATPTNADDFQDVLIAHNWVLDVSLDGNGNYDGIALAGAVSGYVAIIGNVMHAKGSGFHVRYGVSCQASATNLLVAYNVAQDAGTAAVLRGTTPSATTVYLGNVGPADVSTGALPPGGHWLGPWHATNPGASFAEANIARPGTDGNLFFLASGPCKVAGIQVLGIRNGAPGTAIAAGANVTATAKVGKNGSAGTLAVTYTPDGTAFGARAVTNANSDQYVDGDRIGVRLSTGSAWGANDDVTVDVYVVPL